MYQKGFFFKDNLNNVKRSYIFVSEEELYTPEKSYGFVTKENIKEQELLQIPAIMSGFIPVEMETVRPIPTMFRASVGHQGNYRVEIEAENDGSEAQIFLERRRLYYLGKFHGVKKFVFTVNVCDIIPEWKERIYTDTDLDIAWIGDGILVHSIEIKEAKCPTIYIAGDSTVTDQPADYPYSPGCSYSGWGQMLPVYLTNKIAVSNHSHSGLTTETFRKEGHYSIIAQNIKPGDYFFIQFGHNDQKVAELKEDKGYRENLKRYISEIRSQRAYPVIVTSLARNTWRNNGKDYQDWLEDYANECIRLGAELNVPVLDLHKLSMELFKENGMDGSKIWFFPGDLTHTNDYGAYLMAGFIAKEIKRVCGPSKENCYKALADLVNLKVNVWEVDKEKLVRPVLKNAGEQVSEEPYELKMDRLEEIIRSKKQ